MKRLSKVITLFLVALMIAGTLCGCGSDKVTREKGKYSYWVVMDSRSQESLKSYDDLLMYQELAKKAGIEIDFIHPTSGSTGSEAFQILLTSTNLPDMVEYSWSTYPGGADEAIDNKVIISLNKYLEEYAPDYYDYMEGERGKANNYLYKKQTITPKGNYYGFNKLSLGNYRGFSGLYIRKDLLDKWGLDVPVTIDDWSTVFATAKNNGIKYPLTGEKNLFSLSGTNTHVFNNAWNVGMSFHLEDDKVIFSPEKAEYKEYIKQMAEWMKKGYIDPDFITNDSEAVLGKITHTMSIASYGYVGGGLGKIIPAMENNSEYPDFQVVACPFPVLKEGNESWFQPTSPEASDPSIAITVACGVNDEERYKEAISFCNGLYTEEGKILKSFGVEGKTYTKTEKKPDEIGPDGDKYKYTYTSIITDDNDPARKDINAHSVEAALYHFMMPGGGAGLTQHPDYLDGFYTYEDQKNAIKVWNQNIEAAKIHVLPTLTMTDEETERINTLRINTFDKLEASISNIILGKEDINTYEQVVKKAKDGGMAEIRDIYQAAYDRYNRNL